MFSFLFSSVFNFSIDIRARRMHIHLFRALLIQVSGRFRTIYGAFLQFSIPVLTSLFPLGAIFLLPATGVDLGQLGSVLGLMASVYPVLDPILIIVSISRSGDLIVKIFVFFVTVFG